MKVLWVARYNNQYIDVSGGRKMIGFCGWHEEETSAFAEAVKRYPDIDPATIVVNRH